jgi:hypothetical protein
LTGTGAVGRDTAGANTSSGMTASNSAAGTGDFPTRAGPWGCSGPGALRPAGWGASPGATWFIRATAPAARSAAARRRRPS